MRATAAKRKEAPASRAGRKRGGASFPCPKCKGNTHVIITRRNPESGVVERLRECLKTRCKSKFTTHEDLPAL